ILERLIATSDVLVENFRPGTLAKLGLDYQTLAASHPGLVYASISGFGHTGPRSAEAGYDAVMQGEGGLMSITGAADGPPFRRGGGQRRRRPVCDEPRASDALRGVEADARRAPAPPDARRLDRTPRRGGRAVRIGARLARSVR